MIPFPPPCAHADAERLLNEYVDGELRSADQPALFTHLATCAACRAQFNALLAFRLAARQEPLDVPPAADAALFARLDRTRRVARRQPDRSVDRQPFGGALRRRVSVGVALAAVGLVVALGAAFGSQPTPASAAPGGPRVTLTVLDDGALYLVDPGVTVEARAPADRRRTLDADPAVGGAGALLDGALLGDGGRGADL